MHPATLLAILLPALPTLAAPFTPSPTIPSFDDKSLSWATFYTQPDCQGIPSLRKIAPGEIIFLEGGWVSVWASIKGNCHLRYCNDFECRQWMHDDWASAMNDDCSSTLFEIPGGNPEWLPFTAMIDCGKGR